MPSDALHRLPVQRAGGGTLPRGSGTGIQVESEMQALALGKGRIVREGKGTAILAFGTLLQQAKAAAEALDATLVDMRFVKPMDEALVLSWPRLTISSSPSRTTPSWAARALR